MMTDMRVSEVLSCSFPEWYPKFKKESLKSICIPLSNEFLHYLRADGVVLPEEAKRPTTTEEEDDDDVDWDSDTTPFMTAPSFPLLDKQIADAIEELGGSAFPKLNWSCPKDAFWISTNNSLRCRSASDVYLLLKCSSFISHDLTQPYHGCTDERECGSVPTYILTLRKWTEVNPAEEFRCFVKNHTLIGVCQREATQYYPHIVQQQETIMQDINAFFKRKIQDRFPLQQYVFDIIRSSSGQIRIVDFNPFGSVTDSILFDWSQLEADSIPDEADFRCITESSGVQPSTYQQYAVPTDFLYSSASDMIQLMKSKTENDEAESSEEES